MKVDLPINRIIALSSLFLLLWQVLPTAQAANLTQAMLRIDRLAGNAPLTGLVCATPSAAGAGTEGQVKVTFPTDFSLSTTAANWTTGTSGLPSGATAWPGISATAQNVSGNTVTFTSNDLTSGAANYCFTFTAASSATGSTGAKSGTITTAAAGGSTIDSRGYGLTITKDRIGVTAVVAAQPSDFSATLTKVTSGATHGQDTEIEYQLAYASLLSYPATSVSLQATWSLGTIEGSGTPTVELLDYVTNSATTAYNGTPAVIDVTNRTITWTIGTLPAGGSGTVRFKMKTNNSYTGSSPVSFTVSGRMLGPATATSYSTVTSSYLYNFSPPTTPGPTNTPGPTTPTPTPSTTPQTPFRIQDVDIRLITANSAQIAVLLSHTGTATLNYGLSPTSLPERVTSVNRTRSHLFTFPNLNEDTPYYFTFTATDTAGRRLTSDIYTFTTARASSPPKITPDTFIATSDKNLIFSFLDRGRTGGLNFIIVPTETVFETQFAFPDEVQIKSIKLIVRDKNVLSINTFIETAEAASDSTPLLEVKSGVFSGRLKSSKKPGNYEIYARVEDYNGNLAEEKIADLKVSRPFSVFTKNTDKPVENAKVRLFLYNEKNRTYEYISPQLLPIQNPSYSDRNGRVPLVLPIGRYRAEVTHVFHETQTLDFTIGPESGSDYPAVLLSRAPFSILRTLDYIIGVFVDVTVSLGHYLGDLTTSKRLFDILGLLSLIVFIGLSLMALSERLHIRLRHLPSYFLSLLRLYQHDEDREHAFRGLIRDGHEKQAVSGVNIFVTDTSSGSVIFHTKSNMAGRFRILLPRKETYTVTLEKVAYHPVTLPLHLLADDEEQQFAILQHEDLRDIPALSAAFIKSLLGMSFEVLLLLCLILIVLLVPTFGLIPVLPFVCLSVFNLVFWGLHEIHVRQ